ncbi:MAG: hypothetical protein VW874_12875, partial [Gammaproteobacteria bacterium]
NESSLTNAPTAGRYTFQDLYDLVENFQYKLNLPVTSENWEMEVNFGGNFVDKLRRAENRRLDINTRAFENSGDLSGYLFSDILSDDAHIRPAWMDEIYPKDMTELQLKELDEFDEKCRLFAEEQVKYKKALEVELKALKQSNVD